MAELHYGSANLTDANVCGLLRVTSLHYYLLITIHGDRETNGKKRNVIKLSLNQLVMGSKPVDVAPTSEGQLRFDGTGDESRRSGTDA